MGDWCTNSTWENYYDRGANFSLDDNAEMRQDYIQMSGITNVSGRDLNAGPHSESINTNLGWIFENLPPDDDELKIFTEDLVVCQGFDPFILNEDNIFGAESILWNDTDDRLEFEVSAPGTYRAKVTYEDGCSVEDTLLVKLSDEIVLDLGSDTTLCGGDSLLLSPLMDHAGIYNFEWSTGIDSPELMVTKSGTYSVTVSSGECEESGSITVDILDQSSTDLFYPKDYLCDEDTILLEVLSTADHVEWDSGETHLTRIITQPGTYYVKENFGDCVDSSVVEIHQIRTDHLTLDLDTAICSGKEITYHLPDGNFRNIKWDGVSGNPSKTFSSSQTVRVDADYDGCPVSGIIRIDTESCDSDAIGLPNAFAPNGSGVNKMYRPVLPDGLEILNYRMEIYDRWGNLLYHTQDPNDVWSGDSVDGVVLVFLSVDYLDQSGEEQHFSDSEDVLILR